MTQPSPTLSDASPLALLKSHFGYEAFRPLQAEIIDNVLAGRDGLVLMPTGGGKSLCYQLPALMFEGVTLVVSPLIALMKDQVDALSANGVAAGFVNSSMSAPEAERALERARRGEVKLLYAAPERLALPGFRRFLHSVNLSLIAIDEAHCISEWGHEFRPDYRNLRQLRAEFPAVPVIALTASATERVRDDIVEQLGMRQGRVFASGFNRPNLTYSVRPKEGAWEELTALLEARRGQSAIVYCFSRQETEDLAERLNAAGFRALPYHAGLEAETRRRAQEAFVRDRTPIVVATIAFGLGIDKPDVRLVVHYSLPKSLEGYYQETGRAGRDGLPSECVLFYAYADKRRQDYFISRIEDAAEQRSARQRLAAMVEFARLTTCRRRFLLAYFGERGTEEHCGACDACLAQREEFDATEIAQKALSAVIRTGERFGARYVVDVLVGSRSNRVVSAGHDRLSVHGVAKEFGAARLGDVIAQLRERGLLTQSDGEYPTLAVTQAGRDFLVRRESLRLRLPIEAPPGNRRERGGSAASGEAEYDARLFEELRALRKRLADERNVPPYVIFWDTHLRHVAAAMPRSMEQFARVPGVGKAKLEQYGPHFVAAIRAYAEANGIPDAPPAAPAAPAQPASAENGQREGERRDRSQAATQGAIRELLARGLSLAEIAAARGLTEKTIIGHLERMAWAGEALEVRHLLPDAGKMEAIEEAFGVCGGAFLKPVWEFLGAQVAYEDLRLARIHLRQEGRLREE